MRMVLLWLFLGTLEALFRFVAPYFGTAKVLPSPIFGAVVALSYTTRPTVALLFISLFTISRDLCFTDAVGVSTAGYAILFILATRAQNAMNLSHPGLLALFAALYELAARTGLYLTFDSATYGLHDVMTAAVIAALIAPLIFKATIKIVPPPRDKHRIPTDAYFLRRQF